MSERKMDQDEDMNGSVILDLNPEKYEKPKDHLFFDLFSMYTKTFVKEKKNEAAIHWITAKFIKCIRQSVINTSKILIARINIYNTLYRTFSLRIS